MNSFHLNAVSLLSELRESVRLEHDWAPEHGVRRGSPSLARVIAELRAPVRSLTEAKLVTISSNLHIFDALRVLEEHEVKLALVQETKDTILGVVSRSALEELLTQTASRRTSKNENGEPSPTVTAVMGRNISIETSDATVLEVLERMTVGACPFVVIVNELGHPYSVLDPEQMVVSLASTLDALEFIKAEQVRVQGKSNKLRGASAA